MEYLSRKLNTLKHDRLFKFHPKCSRLNITHLFFADDLLLFGRADMNSIVKLHSCMNEFSKVSGLNINPDKCSVYLSGIDDNLKLQICSFLNFSEGCLPVRYLGMPPIAKRLSWLDCSPLISKISEKFQHWQNKKTLSYAGRLQLIKSVILGVHIYWTNNYILPSKVLNKIDRLCSEFLWNHKIPLVSWSTICQEKRYGGLGVFSARIWNQAAALKLLWMIHIKKDLLWIKWVHGNYLLNADIWSVQVKSNSSWMWKQILKTRDVLIAKLGNINNLIAIIGKSCVGDKVQVSSVYSFLVQPAQQVHWANTVWNNIHYPKHSFILWLAVQSRLITQDRLCRMGILNANQCVLCTNSQETCHHLFFECQYSSTVWNMVMVWMNFSWKSCIWDSIIHWFSLRLNKRGFVENLKRLAFGITVYFIWQERNLRIFQGKSMQPDMLFKAIKISFFSKIMNEKYPAHLEERISEL
ncbi:uncharacterized protein LOC109846100 [Asparagus officinalis]|uniref:uncharacterized protein LOC109846100 n=1 Tax=Asparagus officinalis TaxID=4686 RepID=UPI00098E2989|nr:uncharacterized protein LOC109846100 [Asparagus officinalis]